MYFQVFHFLCSVGSILRPGRFRRDPRQLDEEEEMWFNDDEYEDESGTNSGATNSPSGQTSASSQILSQSTSISPLGASQLQQASASSNLSPGSGIANSSSPTGNFFELLLIKFGICYYIIPSEYYLVKILPLLSFAHWYRW